MRQACSLHSMGKHIIVPFFRFVNEVFDELLIVIVGVVKIDPLAIGVAIG